MEGAAGAGREGLARTGDALHGHIVDISDGTGIPYVEFNPCSTDDYLAAWSSADALGCFVLPGRGADEAVAVEFRDQFSKVPLGRCGYSYPLASNGDAPPSVKFELAIGPTFHIEIDGPPAQAWRGRVVERSLTGGDRPWTWRALYPGPERAFYLRYPQSESRSIGSWDFYLQVESATTGPLGDRPLLGEAELPAISGAQDVQVMVHALARIGGFVLDSNGDPVNASVFARRGGVPGPSSWVQTRTGPDGHYLLSKLLPGDYKLTVASLHQMPVQRLCRSAGTVWQSRTSRLRCLARGAMSAVNWWGWIMARRRRGLLLLEPLDGRGWGAHGRVLVSTLGGSAKRAEAGVSPGSASRRFRKTVSTILMPLDGCLYRTNVLDVKSPSSGVVFRSTPSDLEADGQIAGKC